MVTKVVTKEEMKKGYVVVVNGKTVWRPYLKVADVYDGSVLVAMEVDRKTDER